MKYKTVCYVWIRNRLYTHVFSNDKFTFLKNVSKSADRLDAYYAAEYSEIDKIIVREESCQTGN